MYCDVFRAATIDKVESYNCQSLLLFDEQIKNGPFPCNDETACFFPKDLSSLIFEKTTIQQKSQLQDKQCEKMLPVKVMNHACMFQDIFVLLRGKLKSLVKERVSHFSSLLYQSNNLNTFYQIQLTLDRTRHPL